MKSATLTRAYRAARYPAVRKQAATCRINSRKRECAPLCQWSNVELIADTVRINRENDAKAEAAVARGEYKPLLWDGYDYAQGIINTLNGNEYIGETDREGVYVCWCEDYQGRIVRRNNELRKRGIALRAFCKHPAAIYHLERAAATVPLCAGMVGAAPSVVGGRAK